MSALLAPAPGGFAQQVLGHLDAQIESTERLLEGVLRQGEAVRRRDVDTVLAIMAAIQQEMDARGRLEQQRTHLLRTAGAQLGLPASDVTLERMSALLPGAAAEQAAARSAHLRGLLATIEREHAVNRALMRQELSFLDHLVRLIGGDTEGAGYTNTARRPAARPATASRMLRSSSLQ